MLQAANTDLWNPIVPKAHNSVCQNLLFPLQIQPVKVNLMLNFRIFIFCALGTNGLRIGDPQVLITLFIPCFWKQISCIIKYMKNI